MRLYELKKEYTDILDQYENAESEEQLAEVATLLANIQGELSDKLDNCGRLYRNLCSEADKFKAESNRLKKKASALENRAERIKNYIAFTLTEGVEAKTELFKFRWSASTKTDPYDMELIPASYKRTTVTIEPDKKAIKDDIEAGIEVPGARLLTLFNLQIK